MTIPWVGSPSIVATPALKSGRRALYGTYGVADFTSNTSPTAKAFAEKYYELNTRYPPTTPGLDL